MNDMWGQQKKVVLNHPNKENLMYEASLSYSPTRNKYIPKLLEENENSLLQEHTGIVDSGERTCILHQMHHMDH